VLAALAGGLNRLPRQIGPKRALGMILTGRHVSPEEGVQLGFVNEVVPHEELMSAAMSWAKQICECAPLSIRASKDVVYQSVDSASLQDAMEANYESVQAMIKSEDFIEGPKAFSEKRPPRWQGK
ncbi:MAG TPA: enoyl-CoA hydratase, partial [Gammaproteobacteria bacterium]|nr:enoyl-CoA hydratase [Gammaproteobacteria bacterium]